MATNSVIRQVIAGLLVFYGSSAGVGTISAAESAADLPQVVVRIGDLNLGNSRGISTAYNRLLSAAQRVCAGADSADYWVRESAIPCIIQAVSRAIDTIGVPQLNTYAQAQPLFRLRHAEAIALAN
jgi:UrcA family protein